MPDDSTRLTDRLALHELRARYTHCYDGADLDGFVALFTDDGMLQLGPRVSRGATPSCAPRSPRRWPPPRSRATSPPTRSPSSRATTPRAAPAASPCTTAAPR